MAVKNTYNLKAEKLQREVGDRQNWRPPASWQALPDVTSSQLFVGRCAVQSVGSNFVALSAAGNYTVDWGDGTVTNHTSGTTAYKEYTYASIPDTGESELGYRQVLIQVYPQIGNNLTSLAISQPHSNGAATGDLWREIALNAPFLSSLNIPGNLTVGLECATGLLRCCIYNHALTSAQNLFFGCRSLRTVFIPTSSGFTNTSRMFYNCNNLIYAPFLDTKNVTTMSEMFYNCYCLRSVPIYDTSKVTTMNSMFYNCSSIREVPMFNTVSVTNMASMFVGTSSLDRVPSFNTSNVTTMSFMFSSSNLRYFPFMDTSKVTDMSFFASRAYAAMTFPEYDTSKVTNMSTFTNIVALKSLPAFNLSSCTSMSTLISQQANIKLPLMDTSKITNFYSAGGGLNSGLSVIPAYNLCRNTSLINFANAYNVCVCDVYRVKSNIAVSGDKLSATQLNKMYTNLAGVGSRSISSASGNGTTITYTTTTDHPYQIDQTLSVTGLSPAGYNVTTAVVTAVLSPTQFQVAGTTTGASTGTGTVSEPAAATITVTGNYGTASDDPSIATAKGWTVTG